MDCCENSEKTILKINDMSCGHCKMKIEEKIKKIEAVDSVIVNLRKGTVIIKHGKEVTLSQLKNAIAEAGYGVE